MPALTGIDRVVVLMLENRSFDCVFGKLYPKSAAFEGLSGHETNPLHKNDGTVVNLPVWNDADMGPATACIPDPDPGELFLQDMNIQLFGPNGTPGDGVPTMNGFADNYAQQKVNDPAPDPMSVLHFFTPRQVPVISQLAKSFGVSDQWHASAPCQTWPNRFFVHTGTAGGYVDNSPAHFPYLMPSIFKRLSDREKTWKVYFHDLPQAATLADIWLEAPFHFKLFDEEFAKDAAAGELPNYSFIEPRYFTDDLGKVLPSDQHPPHNVVYGEQLIAAVYNAVRSAPTWKQTLLIITYDEHGGCYDHVPPPLAIPPDAKRSDGFAFDRYGIRVPAVIISPFMPPGEIVRVAPTGLPHQGPPYPFDHTSILATLRKLFDLGAPLTARDAVAPDLIGLLSLENPENDGPASVSPTPAKPTDEEIAKSIARPPNHMQKSLCSMAAYLPISAATAGAHLSAIAAPGAPAAATSPGNIDTKKYATDRLKSFLT